MITPARHKQAAPAADVPWHALPVDQVLSRLGSSRDGLSPEEAARRLRQVGENALSGPAPRSDLAILGEQLANVPAGLLLGSSAVSLLYGEVIEAGAILAVLGLNSAIGYTVERKSEDLLASWQQLEAGEVEVIRGGTLRKVPARSLVPGDMLVCHGGAVLPADARVVAADHLSCNEAPLTGESEPQDKSAEPVARTAPLPARRSMLYGGTVVAAGRGRAVVTATGPATEAARVRQLIEAQRAPRAPLVLRLGRLTNQVAAVGLGGALAAALAGLARGRPLGRVLRTAVALGVAALPEGLPVVSTAALVRCMQRLRERGMVVRRLGSAETLGGVTVICADKTGTLTQNQMRLEVLEVAGAPIDLQTTRARPQALFRDLPTLALAAGVLNSDVEVQRGGGGVALAGSATERALVEAARQAGLDVDALRAAYPRRVLRSRGNGLHYVISVHDAPARRGGAYAFIKGAPEQVLPLCAGDNAGPLTDERRRQLGARAEALAEQGLRVLALGYCRLRDPEAEALPGFTFLGFAGLRDPLRPGAARAVRAAAGAGIRTLVLTGDHSRTAAAVARQVGLRGAALSGDGSLAERLRDPQVRARLHRLAVLSRVTPEDKLAAVAALRGQGDIVAMVGDGINDAPALKAADVGIAVGRGASDLARQVADVVLAREDLHSILVAVAEGRIVQDNLRRALRFLLATNLSELTLVLGAAVAGAPDPLTPLQLLWLNLLTDTLPGLALALAPGDPEVLDRGPAPPGAPLLPAPLLRPIVRDGLLMSALGAAGFLTGAAPGAFGALSGAQLAYTTVCQAPGPGPDPLFLKLVGGSIGVQLLSLVVSPVRAALGLPGAAGREVLLFLLGLVLPWFAGRLDGEVIIRRGLMADGE